MSKRVVPELPATAWDPEDVPHGQNADPHEPLHPVLRCPVLRSFRADLRQKMVTILQAYGGYGKGGLRRAAAALRLHQQTVCSYLMWRTRPDIETSERIDELYIDALDRLAKLKAAASMKEARRTRRQKTLEEELQAVVDARGL
jgi:hypothetical protein